MSSPKKWKIAAIGLSFALACSLGSLAFVLHNNYCYKRVLSIISQDAGRTDAMVRFYHGYLRIYEMDQSNREGGFSGRYDGPFEVWLDAYRPEDPKAWKFSREIFWEEHNKMMRYMKDHPKKFRLGSSAITNSLPHAAQ